MLHRVNNFHENMDANIIFTLVLPTVSANKNKVRECSIQFFRVSNFCERHGYSHRFDLPETQILSEIALSVLHFCSRI